MRFLLGLAVLVGAIYIFHFLYSRFLTSSRIAQARQNEATVSNETETIVRCQHCGTYVPASEVVSDNSGKAFCSENHRREYFSTR